MRTQRSAPHFDHSPQLDIKYVQNHPKQTEAKGRTGTCNCHVAKQNMPNRRSEKETLESLEMANLPPVCNHCPRFYTTKIYIYIYLEPQNPSPVTRTPCLPERMASLSSPRGFCAVGVALGVPGGVDGVCLGEGGPLTQLAKGPKHKRLTFCGDDKK